MRLMQCHYASVMLILISCVSRNAVRHAKPFYPFARKHSDLKHARPARDAVEQTAVVDGNILCRQDLDDLLGDHAAC
jgi:hypothetical protein